MADLFALRIQLDRPFVPLGRTEDVSVLVSIDPQGDALAPPDLPVPVHLILLVDVSGSMNVLMRRDPKAQKVGAVITEGRHTSQVITDVPSRRQMACSVVRDLVGQLGPDDWLTLIAFDHQPYILAQGLRSAETELTRVALQQLAAVGGGDTSLAQPLELTRQILDAVHDAPRLRKLVLLTDGQASDPREAQAQAQILGSQYNLPIAAVGTGECKVSLLSNLAKTTLAGTFHHIRHESEAAQLFYQILANQKNILAANAVLKLWLSPDFFVREMYRTRPEILFVGDIQPDADNVALFQLEHLERGKAYEFLFRCTLPARPTAQRFRLAKATLTFDLPLQRRTGQSVEANIIAEYASDPHKLKQISGDIRRILARAEVQRQVLFLQHKIDALRRGQSSENDAALVAKLLQTLIAKFTDFGDQAMVNQYAAMRDEFLASGTISQEMLNRSLAASSRAEDLVVAQDIDF